MADKQVFSNVVYFLSDVLYKARISNDWNEESVCKAFDWAEYVHQVYDKCINSNNSEEIDCYLKAIGISIEGELTNLRLEYLKYSSEILVKTFLENAIIKSPIQQFILDTGKEKGLDVDLLLQQHKEMKALCDDIINVVHSSSNLDNGQVSAIKEIEAEFLIEHVKKELRAMSCEQKIEEWILQFLQNFFDNDKEIDILLYILLIDAKRNSLVSTFQKFIMTYLYQRIAIGHELFDKAIACKVWTQPESLLRAVSEKHKYFYECYSTTLAKDQQIQVAKDNKLS